jgi:uncharacterized protein (DUF697 family)
MLEALKQIRSAFSLLNPDEVRQRAGQPIHIGLVASSHSGYREMEDLLSPAAAAGEAEVRLADFVHRADENAPGTVDLVLYQEGIPHPKGVYTFHRHEPEKTIAEVLADHPDFDLALARRFPAFRKHVAERIIQLVARENAFFSVVTALPDVIPSLAELPWMFGEFASDTAFLTGNQIRMAFLLAAACGRDVGYMSLKAEIAGIAATAFGWRAIARELVGLIPFGAGLIPKGAIAYAGTFVVGKGLERLYHANEPFTREERREAYRQAFEQGRAVAESITAAATERRRA